MSKRLSILVLGVLLLALASVYSSVVGNVRSGGLTAGVGSAEKGSDCPPQPPREFKNTPYYTGPLFDAHLHLPSSSSIVSSVSTKMGLPTPAWGGALTYEYVRCMFNSEGTRGAFGFHLLTKYSLSGEVSAAKALDRKKSGVVHFLMPTFVNSAVNPSVESVRRLAEKNPGLFTGIGEVKFFDGTSPDAPAPHELYTLADKHGLIVMMHPFNDQKDAVTKVIEQYPKVTFLLHGIDNESGGHGDGPGRGENVGWVTDLIRTHRNVYYSVDDAPIWGWKPGHAGKIKPSKEEVMAHFREVFDSELNRLTRRWKDVIEAHPDRFLSGTDRWYGWHYDRDASALIIEFKRSFIGRLAPEVQEKYAYKNAEALLAR